MRRLNKVLAILIKIIYTRIVIVVYGYTKTGEAFQIPMPAFA